MPLAEESELFRRCPREIDERIPALAAPVIDRDNYCLVVGEIDDLYLAAERQGGMSRRQPLRVVAMSRAGFFAVVPLRIVRCNP